MAKLTMIWAQERYIARVNSCHPGHARRVRQAAHYQLYAWAIKRGFTPADARIVCCEASQMAELIRNSDD